MVTLRHVDLEGKKSNINDFYKSSELDEAINDESTCTKGRKVQNLKLQSQFSVKDLLPESSGNLEGKLRDLSPKSDRISPKSIGELDVAAIKVQKVYKSYRTRRNLADCAVVCEELWWKALDFAALNRCSISYFDPDKSETAVSKWARAGTMAAKVGKGSLKDQKAQRLALRHWLEAIDPRHRYGHNLQFYYAVWFQSQSSQPFFYWLDVGDGKEANLDECPRTDLQRQCINYLGPKERQAYEVTIEIGRLVYKQSQKLVHTPEGSKWIFVLSSSRALYVGEKKKGQFQHSSFLAGGATIASGRLVALNGVLDAIWPYSGHYCPTEKTFAEFIAFLEEHNVDLTNVKKYPIDDDVPPSNPVEEELPFVSLEAPISSKDTAISKANTKENVGQNSTKLEASKVEEAKPLSWTWTTGVGPRIGCVREYPTKLQVQALEQLHLSPRVTPAKFTEKIPIPSPRPSPKIYLSPRFVCLGLQSPRPSNWGTQIIYTLLLVRSLQLMWLKFKFQALGA